MGEASVEAPRPRIGADVKFHRDAYSALLAALVLAGLIAILLAVVNPIR